MKHFLIYYIASFVLCQILALNNRRPPEYHDIEVLANQYRNPRRYFFLKDTDNSDEGIQHEQRAIDSIDEDEDLNFFSKRDTLWTTTEVLDCIRRLKLYKDVSKLDLVTEMLNCYRRLKHTG